MRAAMNVRKISLGIVLLLILANAWKWLPSMNVSKSDREMSGSRMFSAEDFQVHGLTMDTQFKSGRDLFHLGKSSAGENDDTDGSAARKNSAARSSSSSKAAVVQPAAPILSPEELAAAESRTQLAQIKCIGILFQENKQPEAYIVRGDQRYIVRPGDVLGDQFEVEKITIEAVYFRDRQTGVTGTVPVDGKEGTISK